MAGRPRRHVAGKPSQQPQSSGFIGNDRKKAKKGAEKSKSPGGSSSSDTEEVSQPSKKTSTTTRSRRSISECAKQRKDNESGDPSPRPRKVVSESEIVDIERPRGIPLSPPAATPSPPMMSTQTMSAEKGGKRDVTENKSEKKNAANSSDYRPTFFKLQKPTNLDLQSVIRDVSIFWRSICSDHQNGLLKEVVDKTNNRRQMKVPTKKLAYILDCLLIEIFELSQHPHSSPMNNVELKSIMTSFNGLSVKLGYEMGTLAKENWVQLEKKVDDNLCFVPSYDLEQVLKFLLRRL